MLANVEPTVEENVDMVGGAQFITRSVADVQNTYWQIWRRLLVGANVR